MEFNLKTPPRSLPLGVRPPPPGRKKRRGTHGNGEAGGKLEDGQEGRGGREPATCGRRLRGEAPALAPAPARGSETGKRTRCRLDLKEAQQGGACQIPARGCRKPDSDSAGAARSAQTSGNFWSQSRPRRPPNCPATRRDELLLTSLLLWRECGLGRARRDKGK